ncbi:MAG: PQQ-dependent sugar dehydrogenase, partial [Tepidisphaeraceae bacterium]
MKLARFDILGARNIIRAMQYFAPFLLALCAAAASAQPVVPSIALEPFLKGLSKPLYATHDGTSRLFVVEQVGRVRLVENGELQEEPYLDLTNRVFEQGECGLLSVAFHPEFAKNGYLYVNYTSRKPRLH